MNVPVVVYEVILLSEVAGEQDAAGLGDVIGVRGQVGDGLSGKLHRLGVLKGRGLTSCQQYVRFSVTRLGDF